VREVFEETGVAVELVGDRREDITDPVQLHRPAGIQLENIGPGHQHIDLIYFARPRGSTKIHAAYGEEKFGWYGPDEWDDMRVNAEVMVRAGALRSGCPIGTKSLSGRRIKWVAVPHHPAWRRCVVGRSRVEVLESMLGTFRDLAHTGDALRFCGEYAVFVTDQGGHHWLYILCASATRLRRGRS
jgi:hypothetical protein